MDTLRDRVLHLLERRRLTQKEATIRGGLKSTSFINDIVTGRKASVTGKNLDALAAAFRTSKAFLIGVTDDPDDGEILGAGVDDLAGPELMLYDNADMAAGKLSGRKPMPHRGKAVPEYDLANGAPHDDGSYKQRPVAEWGLPAAYVEKELRLSYDAVDILQIAGDSMDDGSRNALVSGDRVLIDRRRTDVRQGGIFAVWDGEGVIVKQVELVRGTTPPEIICKSRNSAYDPIRLFLADKVRIIGRLAAKISRL